MYLLYRYICRTGAGILNHCSFKPAPITKRLFHIILGSYGECIARSAINVTIAFRNQKRYCVSYANRLNRQDLGSFALHIRDT